MEKKMTFNYFYGTEADQFSFYRIPKALFTDSYFKDLSSDAKILYGLMLDRMSLSIKNQWFDDKNRAYIYFSIEDIMELLNCGRNKAIKSMRELDDETGIGLIEKRRQGFGKVNVIYVKTFMPEKTDEKKFEEELKKFKKQTSVENEESTEVYISNPNVIYSYTNEKGERKQKWETYETKAEAKRRKKEIEYKKEMGSFVVRKCKTLDELITEYVALYGKENWALSTYEGNVSLINNYILPIIGDTKLSEINTRFIERYYQSLLKRRAVINPLNKTSRNEFVSSSTVRDVNKLLRNCFEQAVKWELMEKNPCTHATVPEHKSQKRDIWTADTLMYALSVCEDERLKLAINLSFSCSLRLDELLGLTWDCVDISPEAIEENRAYVFINKESQRIRKESLNALDGKDVLLVFPTNHKKNSTVRILKTPKTESSVRKIFLPKSVANMLVDWKAEQDEMKEILGDEYMDYNLVMASTFGLPLGDGAIRGPLKKLIEDYNLPPVVFHSFRHSSVTYKLKLNGGDIKAVQGDSGHAQVNMVTDVYSHILDDDRRKNAELFEEAFYEKKNLDPQMHVHQENNNAPVADEVDPELLAKVLANPEMRALLNSLAKTMK